MILPRDKNYRDLCIHRKVFAGEAIRHAFYSRAQCFLPDTQLAFT